MSSNNTRSNMERRTLGAMLTNAFFTAPSAITIAFFLVMFLLSVRLPFDFWQPWMWLPIGALAEGVYIYATLTDPEAGRRAVEQMLTERFNPASINNALARERLRKALDYKALIDKFVEAQGGAFKVSLQQTTSEINDWVGQIYRLARSIDTFESNAAVNPDPRGLPREIANLKKRLDTETDPGLRSELSDSIQIREKLLDNLQGIANMAKRAEIQMDNTLVQLGTIYAQMQLIDVKALDSGRSQRLRQDIREQISALSDTISAMDDVYQQGQGYDNAVSTLSGGAAASSAAPEGMSTDSGVQASTRRTQGGQRN